MGSVLSKINFKDLIVHCFLVWHANDGCFLEKFVSEISLLSSSCACPDCLWTWTFPSDLLMNHQFLLQPSVSSVTPSLVVWVDFPPWIKKRYFWANFLWWNYYILSGKKEEVLPLDCWWVQFFPDCIGKSHVSLLLRVVLYQYLKLMFCKPVLLAFCSGRLLCAVDTTLASITKLWVFT